MHKLLVTGCRGQLGSELQDIAEDYESLDLLFTDYTELDITDRKAVRMFVEDHGVDCIVNCAAYTAVDKAESDPERCDLLNHVAPGYLAEAIAARGGSMVQISTDYVFDGQGCIPYREDMPTAPQSVYGRTKLAGEGEVVLKCPGAMIIRTAWLYSSYGGNFVKTMLRLAKECDEIGVVADQIGTPTYARDLARAICTIAEQGIVPGIYHFTNEGAASWYDFTKTIFRLEGIDEDDCRVRPLHTEEYPTPAQRPHYSVLDKSRTQTHLCHHLTPRRRKNDAHRKAPALRRANSGGRRRKEQQDKENRHQRLDGNREAARYLRHDLRHGVRLRRL